MGSHPIDPTYDEPVGTDLDGPGVDEVERVSGEVFIVVRERFECPREGCEERLRRHHLYCVEDAPHGIESLFDGPIVEELAINATIVDHDGEEPYLGFNVCGGTVGYVRPRETIEEGSMGGECYGRVEPDPEPYGL